MSEVEDLGSLALDADIKDEEKVNTGRLSDTADNGKVPEGMQVRHEDDDEGGQGIDLTDGGNFKDEDPLQPDDDTNKANANANDDGEDDDEEGDEDEDEDEDDEDEDEDEDDDDDGEEEQSGRPKKKKRRFRANKYVDLEVEVDDSDEEEDEDPVEAGFEVADNYLDKPGRRNVLIADHFDDDNISDDDRDHRTLDRRNRNREEEDAIRIAKEYKERHRQRRSGGMGSQMADFAPKSVLMPSVNDPNIWCVKCKIGREKELVMSISRKALVQNISITSAFQRDSFHGHLYIEARSEAHVREATHGLIGIYGATPISLVPIEEMADLLKSKKKVTPLTIGGWVRIRRGAYKGDLAQIDDVPEGNDTVTLKIVPRIDLNPREDKEMDKDGRKRRRNESSLFRPPPKFFNADEVRAAYAGKAKVVKDAEGFHFGNELYANGYLIKDFRMTLIDKENINPTIDEITRFIGDTASAVNADGSGVDGAAAALVGTGSNRLDLNLVADAAKQQTVLQPGDYVEIFEGSQKGIIGLIDSISGNVVIISPSEPADLVDTKIEVLTDQVRKRFKAGDHIKVLRGKNVNESGLVLSIKGDLVTFLSDLSVQEVTVFSKDIREAAEVGAGASSYGQYELHDLVQLDAETTGVIFKIEPDTFRIVDQTGAVRVLRPSQVGNKLDTKRSVATDHEGFELRPGDHVKEITQGDREPRSGRVLHVYRSLFTFLHNRDISENGGIFVAYARSLGPLIPRNKNPGADLSKMNPALAGGAQNAAAASGMLGMAGAPRREYAVGAHVTVIKGNHKGYKGIIKDLNGPLARVELHTNLKTITIERTKLGAQDQTGKLVPLDQWEREKAASRRTMPGNVPRGGEYGAYSASGTNTGPLGARRIGQSGSATPSYSGSVYASGKTPQYRGGQTPFGGGYGGATPFGSSATPFGAGSSTPYASGRTPAYGGGDAFAASSRTPYVNSGGAFSASSRTPYSGAAGGSSSWGGATPYGGSSGAGGSSNPGWDSASPAPRSSAYSSGATRQAGASAWDSASPAYNSSSSSSAYNNVYSSANNGPTPGALSAPTPWDTPETSATPYASAPTPAANTPYATAPTPAASGENPWDSAPYASAPTPAASHPTPYHAAETPAANSAWDD